VFCHALKSYSDAIQRQTGVGVLVAIEGVEGVGKTTTCNLLFRHLRNIGASCALLTEHYERTGQSGPLIAAITENVGVELHSDYSLFFLYCARLADKVGMATKLSTTHSIVVVDRLALSLEARARAAWRVSGDLIDRCLTVAFAQHVVDASALCFCLDASLPARTQRSLNKPIRRRDQISDDVREHVRSELLTIANRRSVPVIDTSERTPEQVLQVIDEHVSGLRRPT